jgi:outer membrane murein-binding lipoprotein Lpp
MSGPLSSSPAAGAFSRRGLLLGTLTGAALLVTGCTGEPEQRADAVTPAQVDQLAAQVQVQEELVAAYDRALATAPELAASATGLADQARAQLDRLRAGLRRAHHRGRTSGRRGRARVAAHPGGRGRRRPRHGLPVLQRGPGRAAGQPRRWAAGAGRAAGVTGTVDPRRGQHRA